MRQAAQLLLDGLQCGRGPHGVCQFETQGEQRREPADCARHIQIVGDVLPAMAFHFDQERRAACALLKRLGQCG